MGTLLDDIEANSERWRCSCGNRYWEEKGAKKSICPVCNKTNRLPTYKPKMLDKKRMLRALDLGSRKRNVFLIIIAIAALAFGLYSNPELVSWFIGGVLAGCLITTYIIGYAFSKSIKRGYFDAGDKK